jgi:hypothetical protein
MMRPREWSPPFFLGLGCAVAAEMAHGLLLYSTEGFLEALTIVLAVQFGAFGIGVATRPASDARSRTWRWLIGAGGLAVAGVAAFVWSIANGVAEVPGARGTTLVVFGALPMYGFGLVFGGLRTHLRGDDGRMWPGRHRAAAAPAFTGAALGVVLVGVLLLPRLTPPLDLHVRASLSGERGDDRGRATTAGRDAVPCDSAHLRLRPGRGVRPRPMIVAHLSDLHLGHRSFDRAERGQNLRERDLSVAFQRAVAMVVEERPNIVVVSGDVFDRSNPPPGALVALTRGLDEIRTALPDTRVLMVAGRARHARGVPRMRARSPLSTPFPT